MSNCEKSCHTTSYTKENVIESEECQCDVCECGYEEEVEQEETKSSNGKPIC